MTVMNRVTGVSLRAATGPRERRLAALLEKRGLTAEDSGLAGIVRDAQLLGSLELAGVRSTWEEVRASRSTGRGPEPVLALRRAQEAVDRQAPLTLSAIRSWHGALAGPVGFRRDERAREGAPPAPPALIESRLALLETWLASRSGEELRPEQAAALALARLVEVLPFDDANGRVSRLAASHLLVRGGARPPILVAGDGPRLVEAIQAAIRLETASLCSLLEEASGRALDVMIQALEKGARPEPPVASQGPARR
jgi:hypothetical protein